MDFLRSRIIKIVVTLVFAGCMFFANFIAVRLILRYGLDTYFYDKLLVAYKIGGENGLALELDEMRASDSLRRQKILINDFSARLSVLKDPRQYLADKVQESKKIVFRARSLRNVAVVIMFLLFLWQTFVKSVSKRKSRI